MLAGGLACVLYTFALGCPVPVVNETLHPERFVLIRVEQVQRMRRQGEETEFPFERRRLQTIRMGEWIVDTIRKRRLEEEKKKKNFAECLGWDVRSVLREVCQSERL